MISVLKRLAPDGFLSGRRLGIAALLVSLCATFWGVWTRMPWVALMILVIQMYWAVISPNQPLRIVLSQSFSFGGALAATLMLITGR
jgi:hypothetical protein